MIWFFSRLCSNWKLETKILIASQLVAAAATKPQSNCINVHENSVEYIHMYDLEKITGFFDIVASSIGFCVFVLTPKNFFFFYFCRSHCKHIYNFDGFRTHTNQILFVYFKNSLSIPPEYRYLNVCSRFDLYACANTHWTKWVCSLVEMNL